MPSDKLAARVGAALWQEDRASQWLGMSLDHVGAGHAILSLTVTSHHCNGHGTCHGGVTFALADSAFAFACNSRNRRNVAQTNAITYIAAAFEADTLTAEARETARAGRTGIYDVQITNQNGRVVASFRGVSREISGEIIDET